MFALTGYFFRRNWKKLAIFLAALMALSLYVLFVAEGALPVTTDVLHTIDGIEVTQAVTGMKIYEDPSAFTSPGLMQCFIAISAVWLMWRERRFLVTLSLTRGRVLLGSQGYLLVLSVVMTLCYMLLPALGRMILWACGFHLQLPWSAGVILTGGDPDWWIDMLQMLAGCIYLAGWWTLLSAVWLRWWKIILILDAVGLALLILFASQIRWLDSGVLMELEKHAGDLVLWIFDRLVPAIEKFAEYISTHYLHLMGLQAGAGVLFSVLTYPVIRGMKVIK